jgi:hypothetical protein
MNLTYIPVLPILHELYSQPIGVERFREYLAATLNADASDVELTPLLLANPMAKSTVGATLAELLALDADRIAAGAVAEAAAELCDVPGDYRVSLTLADDKGGGWTNRFAYEYGVRKLSHPSDWTATAAARFWLTGVVWSSERPSESRVRETMLCAIDRLAYVQRHGAARTIGELMRQEGAVMRKADCTEPTLDDDDLLYSRTVLDTMADELADLRTTVECLFGDLASATLGFSARGLSANAGLAVALADAPAWSLDDNCQPAGTF